MVMKQTARNQFECDVKFVRSIDTPVL